MTSLASDLPAESRALIDRGDWSGLWAPQTDIALLNHGSYGRTFSAVRSLHAAIERQIDTDPARFYRHDHHDDVRAAADALGSWLGVGPDTGVAFVHNSSTGVLDAVVSLAEIDGPILVTNLGYGGIRHGLTHLAPKLGRDVVDVAIESPDRAEDLPAAVVDAVRRLRPSVVVLDQITSATALRLPLESMIPDIRAASPQTRIVIDGAHAAGMEQTPVVDGADVWVANLHKWVCTSIGAAVVVAPRGSDFRPGLSSWTSAEPFPDSFTWIGTDTKAAYLSSPLATETMTALREAGLDDHITSVLAEAGDAIAASWGVNPDPRPHDMRAKWMRLIETPMTRTFTQDDMDVAIRMIRDELKADVNLTQFEGKAYLRLSAHGYNEVSQYERLVDIPTVLADF